MTSTANHSSLAPHNLSSRTSGDASNSAQNPGTSFPPGSKTQGEMTSTSTPSASSLPEPSMNALTTDQPHKTLPQVLNTNLEGSRDHPRPESSTVDHRKSLGLGYFEKPSLQQQPGCSSRPASSRKEVDDLRNMTTSPVRRADIDVSEMSMDEDIRHVGVILLDSDQSATEELIRLCPSSLRVHLTRIPKGNDLTVESLTSCSKDIASATDLLVPGIELAGLAYACTSSSMLLGDELTDRLLRSGSRANVATSSPTVALERILKAMNVTKVAVGSPYSKDIADLQTADLMSRGFSVSSYHYLGLTREEDVAALSFATLKRLAKSLGESDCEVVFLSCTQLRLAPYVAELEEAAGKPVLGSSMVMLWDLMRLAGVRERMNAPCSWWDRAKF